MIVRPTVDPLEARRLEALIQSTAAKLIMTRRKAEQLREALVVRDTHQAKISTAALELGALLAGAALEETIIKAIIDDLDGIEIESLRVTR